MDIELENNQLRINIQDLFEDMDEEKLEELAEHYLWHSSVYKNLVQSMKESHAAPGFNEELYLLEKAFFTMPERNEDDFESRWESDHFENDIIDTMRHAVREIVKENAKLKSELYKHGHAESKAYNWILEKFGNDIAYSYNRILSNEIYGKPYDYEVANQMADKLNFTKITEEWVDGMIKLFNPEKE